MIVIAIVIDFFFPKRALLLKKPALFRIHVASLQKQRIADFFVGATKYPLDLVEYIDLRNDETPIRVPHRRLNDATIWRAGIKGIKNAPISTFSTLKT